MIISILKNKKIEYPVYLDIEGKVDSTTYKKVQAAGRAGAAESVQYVFLRYLCIN